MLTLLNHLFLILITIFSSCYLVKAQPYQKSKQQENPIPGAYLLGEYLENLKGKRVGLTINHTSTIEGIPLFDTLSALGIEITKIFTPEHGLKGMASNGEKIEYTDKASSFELISLYGKNRKLTDNQLRTIDVMIFDIQDVGVRFYTYISTMHYVMEGCANNNIPLIVLDRPNPNGNYVDGPILESKYRSFVGMHPIPIVHGMTVGELAQMINGEKWLKNGKMCDLKIVKVKNWTHDTHYTLPIKPSPNLPNDLSIALYPSLCLFEQTIFSVGRGTFAPFQQIGHPNYPDTGYSFVPKSMPGAKYPPFEGQVCYGIRWKGDSIKYEFQLAPIIEAYRQMKNPDFFKPGFAKLAGNNRLQTQIEFGLPEKEIRKYWEESLKKYKSLRKKYLLYP